MQSERFNIEGKCNVGWSCKVKVNSPITDLEWLRGFQEVKVLRFHDNGTGWLQGFQPYALAAFTPGNNPGTHFC